MKITDRKYLGYVLLVVAILVAGFLGVHYPLPTPPVIDSEAQAVAPTRFRAVQVDHGLNVDGDSTVDGFTSSGTVSAAQLTSTGDLDVDGMSNLDNVDIDGVRDGTTGYDYFVRIDGNSTGITNSAKTYGLYISMVRPAGYGSAGGDLDDAGLKIRADSHATTTTSGTTLRAIDAEAKVDNPDGTIYNLYGASLTAKSDTSAGSVDSMIALQTNVQNNATVTSTLISADFRMMRQAATEPTAEYIVRIRNSSTSGTGADAGIYLESDYGSSATTDSLDYGLDMSAAAINTADVRGENGETLSNGTDTAWVIGGFLALDEAAVVVVTASSTITALASFQPITSTAVVTDAVLADGVVAGQILIITNENAGDDITILESSNMVAAGDITLTGGAYDAVTFMWDGSRWVCLSFHDN